MKRLLLIIAIAVTVLLIAPVVVKAATGGEVDLYAMIQDLFVRIEEQDDEIAQLKDRIDELETELEGAEEPEPEPEPEPGGTEEPAPIPDTEPAPQEPEPEPKEPVNPYAHLSLDGVHVASRGYYAVFGLWEIDLGTTDIDLRVQPWKGLAYKGYVPTNGKLIAYDEGELTRIKDDLGSLDIEYTIADLDVDPLFHEMTDGVKIGSRTDVINYIESKIAGD